jgi:hypothetical protein
VFTGNTQCRPVVVCVNMMIELSSGPLLCILQLGRVIASVINQPLVSHFNNHIHHSISLTCITIIKTNETCWSPTTTRNQTSVGDQHLISTQYVLHIVPARFIYYGICCKPVYFSILRYKSEYIFLLTRHALYPVSKAPFPEFSHEPRI